MMSGLHDERVKALYLIGENPAQTEPNAHHVEEGLGKLDFLISQDIFLHDMTRKYADVVFPASSLRGEGRHVHEHRAPHQPGARGGAASRATRRATARSSSSWRRRSARTGPSTRTRSRSGTSSPTSRRTGTASATTGIEENGIQWPVPEMGHPGTPFLYAPAPARAGGRGKFFPVEYQRPIEEPDSEYPLVLSTGRTLYHYNSATMTMRESGITDKQEEPFFEITADDASALGLAEGDWARLVSRRGALEAKAQISDRVFPGLVWMALHFAEQKVNWLTHDVGDPLIGTPEFKVSAVRVERAVDRDDRSRRTSSRRTSAAALATPYLYEPECESTQLLLIGSGLPEGAVAATDHQTGGRGRLGRRWDGAARKLASWSRCCSIRRRSGACPSSRSSPRSPRPRPSRSRPSSQRRSSGRTT